MIKHEDGPSLFRYTWASLDREGLQAGTAAGKNLALHAPPFMEEKEIIQVLKARRELGQTLNFPPENWICAQQIHGTKIRLARRKDQGRGALSAGNALEETDGILLCEKELGALIFTADCLPVILYDRHLKKGGILHAGWRGAAGGIVPQALKLMTEIWESRSGDILAAAGPAIGNCCYQVDARVYTPFTRNFPETAPAFTKDLKASKTGESKWKLNLEKAVFLQLEERGLKKGQMEGSGLCSACESPGLFSWRKQGKKAGRMGTYLLNPESP